MRAQLSQILVLLEHGQRERDQARHERLTALQDIRGEIAGLSQRMEDFEGTRQEWNDVLAGVGLVDPAEVDADEFQRLVYHSVVADTEERAPLAAALALSAAEDRAEIRSRVEALEEENARLRYRLGVLLGDDDVRLDAIESDLEEITDLAGEITGLLRAKRGFPAASS